MALKITLWILGLVWFACGTIINVLMANAQKSFSGYNEYYSYLKSMILHYILGPILIICVNIGKTITLDGDKDSDKKSSSDNTNTDFKASDEYKRYII